MSTQHTPGPWYTEQDAILTQERDPQLIAYLSEHRNRKRRDKKETISNARLIAAAPELLDALTVLLDHAQETYPHFESERGQADIARALAAIAKAKGE